MSRYILLLSFIILSSCENEIDYELDKNSHKIEQPTEDENSGQQFICYSPPMATFPGGTKSLIEFVCNNLEYPAQYPDGKVFIEFTVNEDGSVSGTKVVRGLCELCDKNALAVFSKMPKWMPAKDLGKPIKTKYILPVKF